MAEPDESSFSEKKSRLAELEAERKQLLQDLASVKIPAAKKRNTKHWQHQVRCQEDTHA